MNIAVTGEGVTDYGQQVFGEDKWEEGPVQVYLKRIADNYKINVNINPIDRRDVERVRLQGRSIRGLSGKSVPARKFKVLCKEKGYSYGVYYCDADRESGMKNSDEKAIINRYEEVYSEVKEGLDSVNKHYIPMISCRIIENWILADKAAIRELYGKTNVDYNVNKVENLWGDKRNLQSNYPKCIIERLHNASVKKSIKGKSNREIYVNIAQIQNLQEVEHNCKISFKKLKEDYETLLEYDNHKIIK